MEAIVITLYLLSLLLASYMYILYSETAVTNGNKLCRHFSFIDLFENFDEYLNLTWLPCRAIK